MHAFYKDAQFQFAVENLLGDAFHGATDVGEVLSTIDRIPNGDAAAWVTQRTATADRVVEQARAAEAAGHARSAAGRYLRAASYYAEAANMADDPFAQVGISRISCPLLITDPENEQFWPGQSARMAGAMTGDVTLMPFTAAEGADGHCEPLAEGLRGERILDWLDERVPA